MVRLLNTPKSIKRHNSLKLQIFQKRKQKRLFKTPKLRSLQKRKHKRLLKTPKLRSLQKRKHKRHLTPKRLHLLKKSIFIYSLKLRRNQLPCTMRENKMNSFTKSSKSLLISLILQLSMQILMKTKCLSQQNSLQNLQQLVLHSLCP